jgi:hypothetical protein
VVEDLGDTILMRAEVRDCDGRVVADYRADLTIEVEGLALRCERADGTTLEGPEAWFWLEAPSRGVSVVAGRVVASCADLEPASFEWFPFRETARKPVL